MLKVDSPRDPGVVPNHLAAELADLAQHLLLDLVVCPHDVPTPKPSNGIVQSMCSPNPARSSASLSSSPQARQGLLAGFVGRVCWQSSPADSPANKPVPTNPTAAVTSASPTSVLRSKSPTT